MRINVLQITDIHLFADSKQLLKGINTEKSFQAVLAAIMVDSKRPDLVVLTGDLTHLGEAAAYQRLLEYCEQFTCPVYALPGNHDDLSMQQQLFNNSPILLEKSFLKYDWHFILLNSVIPKHSEGLLSQNELNFLQTALTRHAQLPTVIMLHHHVQKVNGNMDTMILTNAKDFLQVIKPFKNVRVVLSGHVHQEFDQTVDHIRYLTSPSTCLQLKVGAAEFVPDDQAKPGYRWLELNGDGTIDTKVIRIDGAAKV